MYSHAKKFALPLSRTLSLYNLSPEIMIGKKLDLYYLRMLPHIWPFGYKGEFKPLLYIFLWEKLTPHCCPTLPRGLYFEHALIYTTWYFLTFWPSGFWEDILKIPFPYYPPLTLIMTKWHLLKKKKLCG